MLPKNWQRFYRTNKVLVWLGGGLLLLWKFGGLLSTVTSGVTNVLAIGTAKAQASAAQAQAQAQAATVKANQTAQTQIDQATISAVNANATAADIATFREDAEALASAFGTKKGFWNTLLGMTGEDEAAALAVLKKYTRVMMRNGVALRDSAGKVVQRKVSLRLPVLYPFYSEITGGNSLSADVRKYMGNEHTSFLNTYLF
ncbi:hypothetical protein F0P96_04420 [Hymenobacter busanensis]|uniref:Uncharacterized protein n=1 Tax=Hymenobacter busanensis TaxID=2607656 RepID=A0A7L4ZTC4_9BACT|nr:hypothetical protein [Hymenobacter busanensis]KAA9339867.1 hypothetical protein F0P96_04420 [Hymenobacter busanensis]QHJ06378.1 hypothetical protein GUY19_03315 [Hymenobacter busanensis]